MRILALLAVMQLTSLARGSDQSAPVLLRGAEPTIAAITLATDSDVTTSSEQRGEDSFEQSNNASCMVDGTCDSEEQNKEKMPFFHSLVFYLIDAFFLITVCGSCCKAQSCDPDCDCDYTRAP